MPEKYIPPAFNLTKFTCPFCEAITHQVWCPLQFIKDRTYRPVADFFYAECQYCSRATIWLEKRMVYPFGIAGAPAPNHDLPQDVQDDYNEARTILGVSPRGAAALLRLCIQKMMPLLGERGKNIDDDIGRLVAKGLDKRIEHALDIVRVIGNEAVHPGQIDLNDTPETATELFILVNLIADEMISEPKRVEKMYAALPATKRESIEKRNQRMLTGPTDHN